MKTAAGVFIYDSPHVLIAAVRSWITYIAVSLYVLVTGILGMLLAVTFGWVDILYIFGHGGVALGLALSGIKVRIEGLENVYGQEFSEDGSEYSRKERDQLVTLLSEKLRLQHSIAQMEQAALATQQQLDDADARCAALDAAAKKAELALRDAEHASELALNEITQRVHSDLENFFDSGTSLLLERLRFAGETDRPFRVSQVDAAVRLATKLFGPGYGSLLAKAAEVARQGDRTAVPA